MEPTVRWWVTSLLFSVFILSLAKSSTMSMESLDFTIRDHAFHALTRRRTGVLYDVPLPPDLSGISAYVERMRNGNLWSKGANFSSIHIPPRTTTVPFARRLVIVYQDLGNQSSSYFDVPGYSLVAPILGCLAYDASDSSSDGIRELEFRILGDPISITFPEVTLPTALNSTIKCARLGPQGSVQLADMPSKNACSVTTTGHYTVVEPSVIPGAPPAMSPKAETRWRVWVTACGSGVVGLALVGLVGLGIFRMVRNKKMEDMERHAEEGEALEAAWAGRIKMPSAALMRTEPVIEDETAAP